MLSYEKVRLQPEGDVSRNDLKVTDVRLKEFLQTECNAFNLKQDNANARHRAHFGVVLCGDKLLDDAERKEAILKLLRIHPDGELPDKSVKQKVVGGEMEGSGMVRAVEQYRAKPAYLVIKGISDWGAAKGGEASKAGVMADVKDELLLLLPRRRRLTSILRPRPPTLPSP